LGSGQIAGIVVGAVLGIVFICILLLLLRRFCSVLDVGKADIIADRFGKKAYEHQTDDLEMSVCATDSQTKNATGE